jgi:hypothetical protein
MVRKLDLDTLILEPAALVWPAGATLLLRELTTDEVFSFAQQVAATAGRPPAELPLHVADCLAQLAQDPDRATTLLDSVPVNSLLDIVAWVQTMDPPTFRVPQPTALAEVVLDGQTLPVSPLLLGTYRQALALQQAGLQDTAALKQANALLIASTLPGVTPARILELPYRKRRLLEQLIAQATEEAANALAARLPLPGGAASAG